MTLRPRRRNASGKTLNGFRAAIASASAPKTRSPYTDHVTKLGIHARECRCCPHLVEAEQAWSLAFGLEVD